MFLMRLEYPLILLAALPVVLVILLIWRRGAARRLRASFTVRLVILMALACALAAPSIAARPQGPSVVFALDVSDSVADDALESAVDAIGSASRAVAARGGTSSLILFAGQAVVARPPSTDAIAFDAEMRKRIFSRRAAQEAVSQDREPAAGDDLDSLKTRASPAVLLAGRLHRAGAEARTVVLTDGMETEPAAPPPLGPGVRIVRLPSLRTFDVALRALRAPLAVRAGEAFDVEVDVWSDRDTEARLSLMLDGQVVAEDANLRPVRAGRSTLRIGSVQNALAQGLHRLQAVLTPERDTEPRNNSAAASFNVVGKSRVLIVESNPVEGEGLSRLLAAQGIEYDRRSIDRLVAGGMDLEGWAVIALAGVTPSMIPAAAARSLGAWLEDGGGLFYVATSAPAAEGAFTRPEFTNLLPVEFEAPKAPPKPPDGEPGPPGPPSDRPPPTPRPTPENRKVMAPSIALLLMIDKSGSMAGDPIALCKEAAIATLDTLGEGDFFGVLAFDRAPVWLQRFEAAHRRELIHRNILTLFADGGTDMLPALKAAAHAFKTQELAKNAGVKHVIILSDGITLAGDYKTTVEEMAKDNIVVSSVCVVGPGGFRDQIMRNISQWGKGRYFFADSFKKVPRIFTEETKFVMKEAAAKVEGDPKAPLAPPPPDAPDPPAPPDRVAEPPTPPASMAPGAAGKVAFKDDHEVIRGIPREPAPPALAGALGGKARKTSYVPLAFEGGGPALALWRYGLGRTAVWMSDIGGPWSAGWEKWDGTTKLFAQIVRHLSNAAEDVGLASAVRAERNARDIEFRVDSDVAVHELAPKRRELRPVPDPEGIRKFVLPLDGTDVRHVSISRAAEGRTESFTLEIAPGPPAEIAAPPDGPTPFSWTTESPAPLERLASEAIPAGPTGPESRVPVAAAFLLAALLLIPVDVALRRLV
jgi:Ca-activated chloride channel family protein